MAKTKVKPAGKAQGGGKPAAKIKKCSTATLAAMKENRAEKKRLLTLLGTLESDYKALASVAGGGGSKKKSTREKNSKGGPEVGGFAIYSTSALKMIREKQER